MSDVFTNAIATHMSNDATLAALIATYASQPAIFTRRPIPDDAILPAIVTEGNVADIPFDTTRRHGREILRDIAVYTNANHDTSVLEQIAERVRELFHGKKLSISGYHHVLTRVTSGPIPAPTGGDEDGRVVTIRFIIQKN